MAECSYARCMQERRAVKKELQKWTKRMVCIVGLERIAEELMSKKKWKEYQNLILKTSEENDCPVSDWEPNDNCRLCDGSPHVSDPAVINLSDSESSSSSDSRSSYRDSPPASLPDNHCHFAKIPSDPSNRDTMTTLESASPMANPLASIVPNVVSHGVNVTNSPPVMPFFSPVQRHGASFPPWYLPPSPHPATGHSLYSDGGADSIPEAAISPATTVSVADQNSDQPLDLSAKTGDATQSLKVPHMDHKQIYKAKPRMSTLSGRRTYTEEELQAALRDIQSGKLGTRRAAVLYGIPRSTLRNKVYKLAMERERDSHLGRMEDEDKELSGAEDEREVEKALTKPLLSVDDLLAVSAVEQRDSLGTLYKDTPPSPLINPFPFTRDFLIDLQHTNPFIPQIIAASSILQNDPAGRFIGSRLPEIVRRIIAYEKSRLDECFRQRYSGSETFPFPNGMHTSEEMEKVERDQNCREDEQDAFSSRASSPSVILKIPSFKPAPKNGVSPGTVIEGWSKNNEMAPTFHNQPTQLLTNSDSSCSPPVSVGNNISFNLRDTAKTNVHKFQSQTGDLFAASATNFQFRSQNLPTPNGYEPAHFKLNEYASSTKHNNNNISTLNNNSSHNANNSNQEVHNVQRDKLCSNKSSMQQNASGKGTRPKRGKYRNYDRDSLMEAVRAVQRGEMSVHRAGSYYGVPHSTLEYKVKERHLMRPRKREPKPNVDDGKKKDEIVKASHVDRSRPPSSPSAKVLKPYAPTSPLSNPQNGLKMPPLFDPSMPLNYTTPPPFPFWPPAAFPSLPIPEFSHISKNTSSNYGSLSPSSSEQFYASQMMQRLQGETSSRIHPVCSTESLLPRCSQTLSPGVLGKNAREIAESLYDGSGTSGSFLDGIIRSSLEMGLPVSRNNNVVSSMNNNSNLAQSVANKRLSERVQQAQPANNSDEESLNNKPVNRSEPDVSSSPVATHPSPESFCSPERESVASEGETESHSPKIQIKTEPEESVSSIQSRYETYESDDKNAESACDSSSLSMSESDATKDEQREGGVLAKSNMSLSED